MDLSDLAGSGWLSSLLGNQQTQPTSLAPPGIQAPTPDSAGLPVNGGGPTISGALSALGQAAPGVQKTLPKPQAVQAPAINFPQPRPPQPNAMAQALAQLMAGMKQPNGTSS